VIKAGGGLAWLERPQVAIRLQLPRFLVVSIDTIITDQMLLVQCLYDACRMCGIVPGETVCDPMCGGGSIPIEVSFMLFC